jgi:hypothetical protein
MAENQGNQADSQAARRGWKTPLFIGVVVGLLVAILGISSVQIPHNFARTGVLRLLSVLTNLEWDWLLSGNSTPDPPVVIRGGSLAGIGNYTWTQIADYTQGYYTSPSDFTPNTIYLDGVDPNPKVNGDNPDPSVTLMPVRYPPITAPGDWIVTLTYRYGGKSKKDPDTTVLICSKTAPGDKACVVSNKVSGNIYLLSGTNSSGNPAGAIFFKDIDRPKYPVAHFDPSKKCDDTSTDNQPYCNHPYDVTVTTSTTTYGPFRCVDGACDIGIGPPPQAMQR